MKIVDAKPPESKARAERWNEVVDDNQRKGCDETCQMELMFAGGTEQ